jgi:hypothetical protein
MIAAIEGAVNFLLDKIGLPSDVIVLGPDDSPELRKAAWYERLIYFVPREEKYFVYDAGLGRLIDVGVEEENCFIFQLWSGFITVVVHR